MIVITMTREMGTLGKDVAAGLAERLGLQVVHHELVEHGISERTGLQESAVHRFLEGEASLIERWRIGPQVLARYTAQEILEIAAKGNVLIRGWGATYLLRLVPHIVSVRICAPMPFRKRALMKRMKISDEAAAGREIERNDAIHNGAMRKAFGIDWRDPTHYAITLNTGFVPVPDCIDQIARLTERDAFQETPQSRMVLMDQLIEARVRLALSEDLAAGLYAVGMDVQVTNGKVTLYGATSDERLIPDLVRRAHSVDGVTGVNNKIQYLSFVNPM